MTDQATAFCAETTASCELLHKAYTNAYESAFSGRTAVLSGAPELPPGRYGFCSDSSDCLVSQGHCEVGFETCWFVGSPVTDIDHIAELFVELGCPATPNCDCPPPPMVRCDESTQACVVG